MFILFILTKVHINAIYHTVVDLLVWNVKNGLERIRETASGGIQTIQKEKPASKVGILIVLSKYIGS